MYLQNTSCNMLSFFDLDSSIGHNHIYLKKPIKTPPKLHAFAADRSISKSSHLDDKMTIIGSLVACEIHTFC